MMSVQQALVVPLNANAGIVMLEYDTSSRWMSSAF